MTFGGKFPLHALMTSFGGKSAAQWGDDVIWRKIFRFMGRGGGGLPTNDSKFCEHKINQLG